MKNLLILLALILVLASCTPAGDSQLTSSPTDNSNTTTNVPPRSVNSNPHSYQALGVGGGGAMSGIAISPYANLWFVGTDMGTLFRSTDLGQSWEAVNHFEAIFDSDLTKAVSPGFSADGATVFHASEGVNPKRSIDRGLTFDLISIPLQGGEFIRYWHPDSAHANVMFAVTNKGILRTENNGSTWSRSSSITEEGRGTFIDGITGTVYHGTQSGVWVSSDNGKTFSKFYTPSGISLRQFTGGRDASGITLSFGDNDGSHACAWVSEYSSDWTAEQINNTIGTCGYVWLSNGAGFTKSAQIVGDHLKMAENDSKTIYATGGKKWIRQYGTKIFVSNNKGVNWDLKLLQLNWDTVPFEPWPSASLQYSATGLDIGWWDDGYESFQVDLRNSNIAAGSGYFFIHSTLNGGENWLAPFTEYKDLGSPSEKKKWTTRGIEVISIYRMKYHPSNRQILYGASADIGGLVSEDAGATFRVSKAQYNSNYDYAFDPADQNLVYAASGNSHDWPNDWHANAITSNGGIFKSTNKGLTWSRLTPDNATYNRQFLSVGYDALNRIIYGGTHETGIHRSTDQGATWTELNNGLPAGNKIIPQIEIDPHNGNAYALLTGNAPDFTNQARTGIYFLDVANGSTTWTLLRGNVAYPVDADPGSSVWYYPTAFAIDFDAPNTIWLVDYENKNNWLMTGIWKTTNRGANWTRMKQLTHATDIKIDPVDNNKVYASGYYTLDGNWGNGGQYHTTDGGVTWLKNTLPPLQQNARSVVINPDEPSKIIYSYFGGGMLKGMNPGYL